MSAIQYSLVGFRDNTSACLLNKIFLLSSCDCVNRLHARYKWYETRGGSIARQVMAITRTSEGVNHVKNMRQQAKTVSCT